MEFELAKVGDWIKAGGNIAEVLKIQDNLMLIRTPSGSQFCYGHLGGYRIIEKPEVERINNP